MEIKIEIIIDVNEEDYNEDEFREELTDGFEERTGYDIERLDIFTYEN